MYMSLVFGDEFLAQGLHLKSHQGCSAGIRTWLSGNIVYIYIYIYIYSGYGKYSDPLKLFTLCYIAAIC